MAFAVPRNVAARKASNAADQTLTSCRRPSHNLSMYVAATPAVTAKHAKMGPPPSTGLKPRPASDFYRQKPSSTRGRIDSRSSECSNLSDMTFSDFSQLDLTTVDLEEKKRLQAENDEMLRIYDEYLMSELMRMQAKVDNEKVEKELDRQVSLIWTQTEELRMRVQEEEKTNRLLKTVLRYHRESSEHIASLANTVKEMDTFLVKFDPLSQSLERCRDNIIIMDSEEMEKMLKDKISALETAMSTNSTTDIKKPAEVEGATFGDCLSELEDILATTTKFYSDLRTTVEAMQANAVEAASLSLSSLQLDKAMGR